MPKKTVKIPAYRHHKGSGQAFVQVNGSRRYLGKYGSEKSQERYRRLVAELLATPIALPKPGKGAPPPAGFGSDLEVVQITAAYWQFAEGYYTKDGRPTGQLPIVRQVLRILREFYAHVPAVEFGPLAIRAIQQHLVKRGLARQTINHFCGVIKHMFKWAASHEMMPVAIYQALATVPGLRKGRTAAREPEPVGPVADEVIDATLPSLPAVVADIVRFQRLTGCRPGEACIIRPCDVDTSGAVWCYRPESHKTQHRGRERIIMVGPKAQDVLRPYLLREKTAYCFTPADSERKRNAERRENRRSPMTPSQATRRRKQYRRRAPGDRYDTTAYRRAIDRTVDRINKNRQEDAEKAMKETGIKIEPALLPGWHPNQLRHSAATKIRKHFGLEAAQVALGHSEANVTQIYAERDMTLAREVMRKLG
jgi:integrase